MTAEPYLPTRVGLDALAELDKVGWSALHHAYGRGVVGSQLSGDVARSLNFLRDDPLEALAEGLWSNICHQGTVYEATAYALPFVAAVAAGDVSSDLRSHLCALLGEIAVNGSFVAPRGSHSGSYGQDVDALIRRTLIRCSPYLESIKTADQNLRSLVAAIQLLAEHPTVENRNSLDKMVDPEN